MGFALGDPRDGGNFAISEFVPDNIFAIAPQACLPVSTPSFVIFTAAQITVVQRVQSLRFLSQEMFVLDFSVLLTRT